METSKINEIVDIRQSPEWGQYLASLGWKKQSLGDFKNLYYLKVGPLTIAKMQRPANLKIEDLKTLDKIAQKNKFAFVKIEPFLNQNLNVLTQESYKVSTSPLCPPSTFFIDLESSIDTLQRNLSYSANYSINRAVREGGRVEFYKNPNLEILKKAYPVYQQTSEKQRFIGPSFLDLETKRNLWGNECHLVVSLNKMNEVQGSNMFLGFNGNAWFIHGGTSNNARKSKLGYLLLWEAILYLKSQGYKLLDLEGKDDSRFPIFTKGWGGFSHFKEKFGGIEIAFPYPQIKYYSKALKFFSKLYSSTIPL